ncbi:MAG: hypothetical protein HY296_00010 [Thaumarchaeota archaeon]|nr:hypothetical protein [Nitrososphaerota archaeon]
MQPGRDAGEEIRAPESARKVHLSSLGFAWSASDPTDVIAPVIPQILAANKSAMPLNMLKAEYFNLEREGGVTTIRFGPRIEGSMFWTLLRSQGRCGLTPDEHAVLKFLLLRSSGTCRLLTDFPNAGSKQQRFAGRTYYLSDLGCDEAASTLEVVGKRGERNSYVPKSGILRLTGCNPPNAEEERSLFESLGEWCFLRPSGLRKL